MTTTPRVGATDWAAAQASPWVAHNEALRRIEAGASHYPVADRVTAPPGTCADGASYIIIATATGDFAGKEGQIATAVGTNASSGWLYTVLGTLHEGVTAYVQDENAEYRWDGTAWGTISGGLTAASTTEQLAGTEGGKAATPDSVAALWEQGSDVASAGTISLGEGGYFNITGTTTITDIDFATDKAGRVAWLQFAGALTLTHGANLILPTAANITTAAGDTALFVSEGSDVVRCLAYNRANGNPLVISPGGGGAAWTQVYSGSIGAGTASVPITGLGSYNEVLFIARGVTASVSGVRGLQASVDGGSTWYTTSGDYAYSNNAGVETNTDTFAFHVTNTTAARNLICHIHNLKGAVKVCDVDLGTTTQRVMFVASSSDINALRLINIASGNMNAGTVLVLAR